MFSVLEFQGPPPEVTVRRMTCDVTAVARNNRRASLVTRVNGRGHSRCRRTDTAGAV